MSHTSAVEASVQAMSPPKKFVNKRKKVNHPGRVWTIVDDFGLCARDPRVKLASFLIKGSELRNFVVVSGHTSVVGDIDHG